MRARTIILSLIGTIVVGCGGSSGSDDDVLLSGVYRGLLVLSENSCGVPPNIGNFAATHNVNQNGSAIVLDDESQRQFVGNVVGAGFSVDAVGPQDAAAGNGVTCDLTYRIEYDDINDDDDATANAEFITNQSCSNGTTCSFSYRGEVARTNVAVPTATPSGTVAPGATPTVAGTPGGIVTGDCRTLNERSYSGDGGCGIGSAVIDVSGDTLLIPSFGTNGATSFSTGTPNSTATSTRADLTVNGIDGYSCSLSCSPPISFTLSCFKEGGDTCSEKF